MAYDPGAIDATLAAAVGDDPALIAELREAFLDSAARAVDALETATGDEEWRNAALRLKGLAASFGAVRLMALANDAAQAQPGDIVTINRIRRSTERL
jgi:HPt (histidine-containing phosphotransfer) domain-containing protein